MVNQHDHLTRQAAFDYYYAAGTERSYIKTAYNFHVAEQTIKNWAKKDNWQLRVQQRDIELAKRMEEKTNETVTDARADYRKIVKAGIGEWVQKFKQGEIEIKTAKDLETLIKLDMMLMGEQTETPGVTVNVGIGEWKQLLISRVAPQPASQ